MLHNISAPGAHNQDNWRWCNKCQGLFFAGNPGSKCPAGGEHSSIGSGNYTLTQNADPAGGQPSWRYCDKCKGLFFGFNPGSKCPAGGEHSKANSGNYALRCFPAWPPSPCSKIAAELAEMKKREFDPELKKWVGSEATPEEIAAKQKELQECYSKYPS